MNLTLNPTPPIRHARSRTIDPYNMRPLVILIDEEPHESVRQEAFDRVCVRADLILL